MHYDLVLLNPNTAQPAVAPLGLEYVAEAVRLAGGTVGLLDLCFAEDTAAAASAYLAEHTAQLVGISVRNSDNCYLLSQHSYVPALSGLVSTLRGVSDAPIVLGGAGYSVMPRGILRRTGADYGIVGDGEGPLVQLMQALRGELPLSGIAGLVRWVNGDIATEPPAWQPLDCGLRLRRQWVDYERYFRQGGQGNLETKRGCQGQCVYCADIHSKGRQYRLRPPAAVVDELETLLSMGIDWLHLCDSEFNLPPHHAEAVCEEIISRGLGGRVHWYAYLAPQPFSERLARLLKEAGCVGVDFGLDSGDERMLGNLGRDFTPAQALETARICRQVGMTFMLDLLIGGPGETKKSAATTIRFAQECEPSCVGVALGVRVYPGTKLAQVAAHEGLGAGNPNLRGATEGNPDFVAPVFYLSAALGSVEEATAHMTELVGSDQRFFFGGSQDGDRDYDYDDNALLVQAIAAGARGAYWDILRRLRMGE